MLDKGAEGQGPMATLVEESADLFVCSANVRRTRRCRAGSGAGGTTRECKQGEADAGPPATGQIHLSCSCRGREGVRGFYTIVPSLTTPPLGTMIIPLRTKYP